MNCAFQRGVAVVTDESIEILKLACCTDCVQLQIDSIIIEDKIKSIQCKSIVTVDMDHVTSCQNISIQ